MSSWLLFALLSAILLPLYLFLESLVLNGIDANVATTIRYYYGIIYDRRYYHTR